MYYYIVGYPSVVLNHCLVFDAYYKLFYTGPSVRCTRSDPCRTRGYICDIPKGMCVKYSTAPPKRSILSVDEDPIYPPDLSTLNPDLNIKLSATALNSLHGRNRRDVLDTVLAGQGTMLGSQGKY